LKKAIAEYELASNPTKSHWKKRKSKPSFGKVKTVHARISTFVCFQKLSKIVLARRFARPDVALFI